MNKRLTSTNTSGFKGVSFEKGRGEYRADIRKDEKREHLGYFPDAVSAALAYDEAAKQMFGDFAYLNFPRN